MKNGQKNIGFQMLMADLGPSAPSNTPIMVGGGGAIDTTPSNAAAAAAVAPSTTPIEPAGGNITPTSGGGTSNSVSIGILPRSMAPRNPE